MASSWLAGGSGEWKSGSSPWMPKYEMFDSGCLTQLGLTGFRASGFEVLYRTHKQSYNPQSLKSTCPQEVYAVDAPLCTLLPCQALGF